MPIHRHVPRYWKYFLSKLEKPFITPVHLTELNGLHDGALDNEALQDYAIFRQAFGPEWGIGGSDLTKREDLLMKIHHAIISVPNRGKVQDALALLGDSPPSYQDFLSAIKSSPGTTASGPSGLTYGMMKAWPEEVSRLAYDLLVKMWGPSTSRTGGNSAGWCLSRKTQSPRRSMNYGRSSFWKCYGYAGQE